MSSSLPKVIVKARRARPFFARHPWLFVTSIDRVEGDPAPGDVVDVFSFEKKFIAKGIFNPNSAIRVRLYRWDGGELDDPFWSDAIASAVRLRTEILKFGKPGDGYRVVSSEADSLSGLTVDRYDRWLSVQFTSLALFRRKELLCNLLMEHTKAEGLIAKTERITAEQEGLSHPSELILGDLPVAPAEIVEHGLTFWVDLRGGQKTGYFLDQRDNRLAVARYCEGKRVLDLYTFLGGFALNALKNGQAKSVTAIDSSPTVIEVARHLAGINGLDQAKFEIGDAISQLQKSASAGERFDVIICDPPKLARSPKNLEDAVKAYLRLNRLAIDVLERDGILVSCSCSGLVDRALFADILGQAAELMGRPIQILEQRGQAADHPVSASCLESDYLKCFICRVG